MEKYVAKWKEDRIVLKEDDYKILLERFDLSNFVKEGSDNYLINRVLCPLCENYFECEGCPFDLFSGYLHPPGCIKIISEVLKRISKIPFQDMFVQKNSVFLCNDIEGGKKSVALIRDLLITKFKVVEE